MPAEQPALCWKQRALPFGFALSTKKLPINTTTIVSIANRPNLYLFYLRAIVTKPNTTYDFAKRGNWLKLSSKLKDVQSWYCKPGYSNYCKEWCEEIRVSQDTLTYSTKGSRRCQQSWYAMKKQNSLSLPLPWTRIKSRLPSSCWAFGAITGESKPRAGLQKWLQTKMPRNSPLLVIQLSSILPLLTLPSPESCCWDFSVSGFSSGFLPGDKGRYSTSNLYWGNDRNFRRPAAT